MKRVSIGEKLRTNVQNFKRAKESSFDAYLKANPLNISDKEYQVFFDKIFHQLMEKSLHGHVRIDLSMMNDGSFWLSDTTVHFTFPQVSPWFKKSLQDYQFRIYFYPILIERMRQYFTGVEITRDGDTGANYICTFAWILEK